MDVLSSLRSLDVLTCIHTKAQRSSTLTHWVFRREDVADDAQAIYRTVDLYARAVYTRALSRSSKRSNRFRALKQTNSALSCTRLETSRPWWKRYPTTLFRNSSLPKTEAWISYFAQRRGKSIVRHLILFATLLFSLKTEINRSVRSVASQFLRRKLEI